MGQSCLQTIFCCSDTDKDPIRRKGNLLENVGNDSNLKIYQEQLDKILRPLRVRNRKSKPGENGRITSISEV